MQLSIKSGTGIDEAHQRQVLQILALSYDNLPYQLKPCFLYLGRFGEDAEIKAETLYQLWIAEGFILSSDRSVEGETLMEVAESYLAELVYKSMVGVKFEEQESTLRTFGTCQLHDLMRDLALSKAREDEFFSILDLRQGNDANDYDALFVKPTYTQRLDVYYDGNDVISRKDIRLVKKASRSIRSVLWFNEERWSGKLSPPIARLKFVNFRFLRVLSFEGFKVDHRVDFSFKNRGIVTRYLVLMFKLSKVLGSLICLRYLSLRETSVILFPSFIQSLEQLQTLDLRGMDVERCPWARKDIMRKMGQLRHLYLPKGSCVEFGETSSKLGFNGLSKLETLEYFDTDWCEVKDLHKLNSLRKLMIITTGVDLKEISEYLESKASNNLHYTFLVIRFTGTCKFSLKHILWCERYKVNRLEIDGAIHVLPILDVATTSITRTLKHLSFCVTLLEEDPMPMLEKLPALHDLHFGPYSFKGEQMMCSANGFPQHKVLKFRNLDKLEILEVEQGSMPNLSELSIVECRKLKELPEGLKFINSLKSLTIREMPKKFCTRVRAGGTDYYKIAHVPSITFET